MTKEKKVAKAFWKERIRGDEYKELLEKLIEKSDPKSTDCECTLCNFIRKAKSTLRRLK